MEENEERKRERLNAAIVAVLNSDEGKLVMFWLLEIAGLYEEAFSDGHGLTGYRLGRQSIARRMIAQMDEIDATLYPRFLLSIATMRADDEMKQEKSKGQGDE